MSLKKQKNKPNFRFAFFSIFLLIGFVAVLAKLFYWQIIKGGELSVQARSQYLGGGLVQAPRGSILAKDGSFLASNVAGWLLTGNPMLNTQSPKSLAETLSNSLFTKGENESDEDFRQRLLSEIDRLRQLLEKDAVWVPLAHKVTDSQKLQIEGLGLAGIDFEPQEIRTYPEASAAAHLLGFLGKAEDGSDLGYFGLEGFYDQTLAGKPGFLSMEADARGTPILLGDKREVSAIEGVDLVTHIDKRIQLLVEEKLADGIEKYGAKSGTIIVMEPSTGAILAMASQPTFDPTTYYDFGNDYFKNPAVSDSFEPGSIFKVLVMAAGFDAQVVDLETKCDICGSPFKVDKYFINTWDGTYRPDSTMVDVIVHSDNVGMVFVGNKLGKDKLYDYLASFGIGEATKIDLQGEVAPKLREKSDWNIVDLAVATFGQGIAVTPIQMIRAVAAIANDGVLVTPQVVDKLVGVDWEQDLPGDSGRRVISSKAASEITTAMVAAASEGEAKWTYRRGFDVAGKTGTAQIPISGHYDGEKTIASFVGFAPSDNPKFIMMVTLREPQSSPWSSETAAPLWYSIADELFVHLGIHPK